MGRRPIGNSADDLTVLLRSWSRGDESALDRIIPMVHDELKRLAHRYMSRERARHVERQDRAHFFATSARLMRRILVDFATKHGCQKRGGGTLKKGTPEHATRSDPSILELEDALVSLEQLDPRKARVIELRYFGGLSVDETAEALGVGGGRVMRDRRLARVWLYRELNRSRGEVL